LEATDALRLAVLLGPLHPESYFNLALVRERRRILAEDEQEHLPCYSWIPSNWTPAAC